MLRAARQKTMGSMTAWAQAAFALQRQVHMPPTSSGAEHKQEQNNVATLAACQHADGQAVCVCNVTVGRVVHTVHTVSLAHSFRAITIDWAELWQRYDCDATRIPATVPFTMPGTHRTSCTIAVLVLPFQLGLW
jgi:hypothetical protein